MSNFDTPRETSAKIHNPCPRCGANLPEDCAVWLWQAKFYCSEQCCREAARNG